MCYTLYNFKESIMSTPSNVSSIMIYKIIRDFEKTGRTMHLMSELDYFSQQVIDFVGPGIDDVQSVPGILKGVEVSNQYTSYQANGQ